MSVFCISDRAARRAESKINLLSLLPAPQKLRSVCMSANGRMRALNDMRPKKLNSLKQRNSRCSTASRAAPWRPLASRRVGLARPPLFLHSRSAKGQFSRSLAELLFAHHRAAQSKLRSLRGRLGPEPMRGAMNSTRLRLPAGGAEWVAVMHGTSPIPARYEASRLRASARSHPPLGACCHCGRSPTSRGGPAARLHPGRRCGRRRRRSQHVVIVIAPLA
jgi:hypothetical protein